MSDRREESMAGECVREGEGREGEGRKASAVV